MITFNNCFLFFFLSPFHCFFSAWSLIKTWSHSCLFFDTENVFLWRISKNCGGFHINMFNTWYRKKQTKPKHVHAWPHHYPPTPWLPLYEHSHTGGWNVLLHLWVCDMCRSNISRVSFFVKTNVRTRSFPPQRLTCLWNMHQLRSRWREHLLVCQVVAGAYPPPATSKYNLRNRIV